MFDFHEDINENDEFLYLGEFSADTRTTLENKSCTLDISGVDLEFYRLSKATPKNLWRKYFVLSRLVLHHTRMTATLIFNYEKSTKLMTNCYWNLLKHCIIQFL